MSKNFKCTADFPVIQTGAGKVRGYQMNDMFYFLGIPYAEAERYRMPKPVTPWDGIKNVHTYGYVCPPMFKKLAPSDVDVTTGYRFWPDSENCHSLNIWTPTINAEGKKPVMFYIHGGGYSWGSCLQLSAYEAANLAKDGDVVVVNFNHRLNALGFLNLASFGEEYQYTATLGIADIIAALDWVQENIERFGGDPNNVTIFGQSGGGGKVQALLQTPAAVGKFHKAIIQSGAHLPGTSITYEDSIRLGEAVVAELGLSKETIDEIRTVPRKKIEQAILKVAPQVIEGNVMMCLGPVPNGYFTGFPLDVGFSKTSDNIPIMIGSCIAEWALNINFEIGAESSEELKQELLLQRYGANKDELIALFQKAYPGRDLVDLYFVDCQTRKANLDILDTRAANESAAATYSYMFAYEFDYNGGYPAWHSSDLPMVFGSTERVPIFNDEEVEKLSKKMLLAWAAFAHTGSPAHAGLPSWGAYTKGHEATMVFAQVCEECVDYDRELINNCRKCDTMKSRPAGDVRGA